MKSSSSCVTVTLLILQVGIGDCNNLCTIILADKYNQQSNIEQQIKPPNLTMSKIFIEMILTISFAYLLHNFYSFILLCNIIIITIFLL